MKIRFDRMEWAGSMGDLGTLLPLAFGMIMINGLSATGLFLAVGLMYLIGGAYYRVPIAVQPMKVISAYGIAMALTPQVITASGILLAIMLLFLGGTGLVDKVARLVPKPVIRGVQLSTGILLLAKGVHLIVGKNPLQVMRGAVEPFLAVQSLGPVPMSVVTGVVFGLAALLLLRSNRFPAGLVVVVAGVVFGAVFGAWRELAVIRPGLHFPEILPFGIPALPDFSFALLALVAPQIPMTMGNAVIANRDLSFEYFGNESRRVTDRALCISMGLANVVSALVGGMPLCHGAGGLAAHYAFGARTAGSNIIIGGLFVALAVFLGAQSINVLHLLPMGVLGMLLFFAGAQLALTIQDVQSRSGLFVMMVMLGITMASNLAWAFGVGLCLTWIINRGKINI
ncbi:putative sulfate/molybdate transporter [Pseudodesulfovibrio thermohalotolerans]|uniref:putative sulfate/molybdate transporter n=1 Tax=Pseudodesulfovibrio thermohalotolerans TaxID=2880651 RepID=UPI0022BA0EEF|nr:putative sulfate/molybdate transporter [Pseudodesulfovibrio thermohalotolerans]WFS61861.1 putative sulfate/molybdate transporter [Pseudodesulfovibrio thermohalotolerans]